MAEHLPIEERAGPLRPSAWALRQGGSLRRSNLLVGGRGRAQTEWSAPACGQKRRGREAGALWGPPAAAAQRWETSERSG